MKKEHHQGIRQVKQRSYFKKIPYDFPHIWNIYKNKKKYEQTKQKHIDTENRVVVTRGEGSGGEQNG